MKYANIAKRILYYWSKLFSSQIVEGNDYNSLNRTIAILIADFENDVIKDIPKIHTKWEIREEEYCTKVLTDVLEIHIIELPKLVKSLTNNNKDNKNLKLWLKFILSPDEVGDQDMNENENIKKAKNELEKIKQDKEEQERALRRMMYVMDQKAIQQYGYEQGVKDGEMRGRSQGKIEGRIEGRKEEKIDIAKKMLKRNIPIEDILEVTGLTEEEIEELKS